MSEERSYVGQFYSKSSAEKLYTLADLEQARWDDKETGKKRSAENA